MKKILFHIGLPKTGTSSIQAFMGDHAERLKQGGILFPFDATRRGPAYFGKGKGQAPHADMMTHFFEIKGKLKPSGIDWDTVFDDFRADADLGTLIVSHEGQSVNGHRLRAERYEAAIAGTEATFVVYLREPASWLNSLRVQEMTSWRVAGGNPARIGAVERYLKGGFPGMLAPFARLGRLEIRDYDRVAAGDRLLGDFLEIAGAPQMAAEAARMKRMNSKSYDGDQVLFLSALKAAGCETEDFLAVREVIAAANRRAAPTGGRNVLPRAVGETIRARWALDRAELASRYGIDFDEPKPISAWPEQVVMDADAGERLRAVLAGADLAPGVRAQVEVALKRAAMP